MADNHAHGPDEHHEPHEPPAAPNGTDDTARGDLYGYLAEYDTPGELLEAARKVHDAGFTQFDCYSPFPVHGIDNAMGIKRTILPLLIFIGGFAGTVGGLLLQWYCNSYAWKWNISGKPTWSIPANIPIAYELTILASVLTAFWGMWLLNKLPQMWHPFFRLERFGRATDDGFFIGIEAKDKRFEAAKTKQLLHDAGAIAIDECYLDPDPKQKQMPRWIAAAFIAGLAFALVPLAITAKARNTHSDQPHWNIFPDMDYQPKYKSQNAMDMFPDDRANRGEIAGTIPRGWLADDDTFYRGIVHTDAGDAWTTGFPDHYPNGKKFAVDAALLARGQNRFNIYCSPCHGYNGHGEGMVPSRLKERGEPQWNVRNLVEAPDAKGHGGVVVQMPNGQLFNTISNGYSTMMGYGPQIPHADRWAIVAYVRALERAQNASLDDIPADQRSEIR